MYSNVTGMCDRRFQTPADLTPTVCSDMPELGGILEVFDPISEILELTLDLLPQIAILECLRRVLE